MPFSGPLTGLQPSPSVAAAPIIYASEYVAAAPGTGSDANAYVTPIDPNDNPFSSECSFAGLLYHGRRCPTTFGPVIVAQYQKLLAFARLEVIANASTEVLALFDNGWSSLPAEQQAEALEELSTTTRNELYQQIVEKVFLLIYFCPPAAKCMLVLQVPVCVHQVV